MVMLRVTLTVEAMSKVPTGTTTVSLLPKVPVCVHGDWFAAALIVPTALANVHVLVTVTVAAAAVPAFAAATSSAAAIGAVRATPEKRGLIVELIVPPC